MNPVEALAVLLAGMGAGAINSIAGSGTLLSFPVLLAVGYAPITANVSNNIGLVPGAFSGAYAFRRELDGQAHRARQLAVGSAAGGLLGAVLLLRLPSDVFDAVIPWLVFAAATLMVLQPRVAARVAAGREARGRTQHTEARVLAPILCFVAGVYGGYFGAAQGIILLATLGALLPDELRRTNALKNVLAMTVNGVAAVVFVVSGRVAWEVVGLIAAGSVAGAFVGAHLGRRVPVRALRIFIVTVGYAVAARLLLT